MMSAAAVAAKIAEVQESLKNWRALGYFGRTDREMFFRENGVKQFTDSGTVLGMGTDSGTPMNFHSEALWREAKVHVDMLWHLRSESRSAQQWMRERLIEAARRAQARPD